MVGDVIVVRPGEKIATDGVVLDGSSAVDASLVTGESVPVEVGPDSQVTGATINTSGRLLVRATRVGSETTLAQMGRLVSAGADRKGTHRPARGPDQRRLRSCRPGGRRPYLRGVAPCRRTGARRRGPRRLHRRRVRAGHRLPLRPGPGHAGGAVDRYRPRRPARHPHQGAAGPGGHPDRGHDRAGQDRDRHHRPACRGRHQSFGPYSAAEVLRLAGAVENCLGAPDRPRHRRCGVGRGGQDTTPPAWPPSTVSVPHPAAGSWEPWTAGE